MAEQVTWTAADGTLVDLTDTTAGYTVLGSGTSGLRSVSYELATQKYAGLDGESVQNIRATGGTPTLGLLIAADTESDFRARARRLRHLMRPAAGMGTLTVTTEDGETRSLDCYCTAGFEGDESPEVTGPGRWWRLALRFFAPSPWWQGPEQIVSFHLGSPTIFFPVPPFKLSPSTTQGQFTVDLSDCDAPVYPTWVITGPGSSLVLTNQTTGQVISLNTSLSVGQSLLIDTRPGLQSIRLTDGTNRMNALTTDPALWPLVVGVNTVTAALAGTNADSRISTTFRPRYAGI